MRQLSTLTWAMMHITMETYVTASVDWWLPGVVGDRSRMYSPLPHAATDAGTDAEQ